MARQLSLGYSPCPNDTYIFFALTHGFVPLREIAVSECLKDVETLNQLARLGRLDLTKISYHAYGHVRDNYALLHSGGALGRGCGPVVIAPTPTEMKNLLLQLYGTGYDNLLILPFDRIMMALNHGEAAAGVIIHESRFTYQQSGFREILDLGAWWEAETGLPIPLGGILARRDLGAELIGQIDAAIRTSLDYARRHPQAAEDYIKQHAQELDNAVIRSHIDLYVNHFTDNLGPEGIRAVNTLLGRAEKRGLIPHCTLPLFIS